MHDNIDTSGWKMTGDDIESVQLSLRRILLQSGVCVADMMRVFGAESKATFGGLLHLRIGEVAFRRCLRNKCGYRGPSAILTDVFNALDTDFSGELGFDELYEFIKGSRHALDPRDRPAMDMQLELPRGTSMDDIAWDVDVLRAAIIGMLARCRVGPPALLRRIKAGRRGLRRHDFLQKMWETFFMHEEEAEDLWTHEVGQVLEDTYDTLLNTIKRENFLGRVGIVHFARWLDVRNQPAIPPSWSCSTSLPLKSHRQRKQQQFRRVERDLLAAKANAPRERVDWAIVAERGIKTAAAAAAEREASRGAEDQRKAEEEQYVQRWLITNALPVLNGWETQSSSFALSSLHVSRQTVPWTIEAQMLVQARAAAHRRLCRPSSTQVASTYGPAPFPPRSHMAIESSQASPRARKHGADRRALMSTVRSLRRDLDKTVHLSKVL